VKLLLGTIQRNHLEIAMKQKQPLPMSHRGISAKRCSLASRFAAASFLFAADCSSLQADIVELKDGGVICGKVLNPQSGQTVQIETEDGSLLEFDRKLVKIRVSLERDSKYLDIVSKRGDSLEDHRAIVDQCASQQG